ncbi:autotransporter outer membrane beta-barrel domain-containing protein [Blastopirellula retiformator]|uniref:Uncharacterized protein n=1 Tax=Blastopirellula retiformator TaxID=2527970 RepID=A0A5C5V821_9BACT|nr:hypothetical protein [Blastopirellula retiformator]TWT34688.1 hypothetical protein Enr8_21010 [Blastopirellula retiformator]
MALFVWRGDAQARAQVVQVTAEFVEAGDVCTLSINRKEVRFTALSGSVVPIYEGLVAAIEASGVPELADITAEVVSDASPPYLKLTGAADGRPFVVTADASNGSLGEVTVATTTSAYGGANEKQQVTLPDGVTGGTFTLTLDGDTTSAIAYNAAAATVQSALEALTDIDSGDVEVNGSSGGPWSVEFKQAYANSDVSLISLDASSLTAGTVSVVETVKGQAGTNEIVRVTVSKSAATPSGTPLEYACSFGVANNYLFRWKDFSELDTAAKFKTAMQEHASVNEANVNVALVSSALRERVYDVEFTGSLGGTNWSIAFLEDTGYGVGSGVTTLQNGDGAGTGERQLVSLTGSPSGGTFTLTYSGQTTAALPYNAAAATVEAALAALSNIGDGDVSVGGSAPNWTIEFAGDLAAQDVPLISGDGGNLTGGAGVVEKTQLAAAPINEKQTVSLSPGVTGGTFTLTYAGQTTAAISFAASSSAVETALEDLSNIDAVTVTGASGGPWIVEFAGSLSATNVATLLGDGDNLTGDDSQTLTITTTIAATGPHHWSDPANWDQNAVPVHGADVRIENSASSLLYGLDQASVTLSSLDVRASFTGSIGLADMHSAGFHEYLPTHLAIGATTVRLGEGEGSGSPQIRLDNGTEQATVTVFNAGSPASTAGYAVEWIGTHEQNGLTVYKGTVGVAIGGDQSAVLATLDVSFLSSRQADALVYLGDDVTVGDIVKNGGELIIAGRSGTDIASIRSTAGEVQLRGEDGVESLILEGGDFYYWSTGTLATGAVVSGDGRLIFDGDLRPKTVSSVISVYGDAASVIDAAEVVNVDGYLSLQFQGTSRFADLGSNIIISRGLPAEGEEAVSVTLYAAAMQMVSVAVDDELESIAAKLTTESYAHPSGKTEAEIIQIDVVAPSADIVVHDAANDDDGQAVASDASEYFPVIGAAATALRLVTETTADVLLKIYYK